MRGLVKLMAAFAMVAAFASVSEANDTLRCDTAKTAAVSKLFKEIVQCNHRAQFDASFNLTDCRTNAYDRCTARITRADASFGNACFFTANFNVCIDTLNAAIAIYPNI